MQSDKEKVNDEKVANGCKVWGANVKVGKFIVWPTSRHSENCWSKDVKMQS